jgi:hypothetical protein
MERPEMRCIKCDKTPSELDEYVNAGKDNGMSADDYCWQEEGTLNRESGHFLCTPCYVKAGMPSTPRGWTAP